MSASQQKPHPIWFRSHEEIRCWSMTSLAVTPCPLSWFAGSRIFNFIRDGSLRITLKYTTLVRMHSGSAWTCIHDNGAEVTNGLQ